MKNGLFATPPSKSFSFAPMFLPDATKAVPPSPNISDGTGPMESEGA